MSPSPSRFVPLQLSDRFSNLSLTTKCAAMAVGRIPSLEVRNLADADGIPCPKTASKQCSDCGSELCEDHVETCGGCRAIFCPSCRFLHRAQHSKPADVSLMRIRAPLAGPQT